MTSFPFPLSFDTTSEKHKKTSGEVITITPAAHQKAIESALAQGRIEGRISGKQAAKETQDAAKIKQLESIAQTMEKIAKLHSAHQIEIINSAFEIARTIIIKLFPVLEDRFCKEQIDILIRAHLQGEKTDPCLLKIHPQMAQTLRPMLSSLKEHIIVREDPDTALADCHILFDEGGGLERSTAKLIRAMEDILSSPAYETGDQKETEDLFFRKNAPSFHQNPPKNRLLSPSK